MSAARARKRCRSRQLISRVYGNGPGYRNRFAKCEHLPTQREHARLRAVAERRELGRHDRWEQTPRSLPPFGAVAMRLDRKAVRLCNRSWNLLRAGAGDGDPRCEAINTKLRLLSGVSKPTKMTDEGNAFALAIFGEEI